MHVCFQVINLMLAQLIKLITCMNDDPDQLTSEEVNFEKNLPTTTKTLKFIQHENS